MTPQDISQALQFKLTQDQFKQQKIRDVMDSMYKMSLIQESQKRLNERDIPKDERTAAIKNYEYAVKRGYEGSFDDWEKDALTTNQKDYKAAVEDGYKGSFHEWLSAMKKLGAPQISIGDRVLETRTAGAKADVMLGDVVSQVDKEIGAVKNYEGAILQSAKEIANEIAEGEAPTPEQQNEALNVARSRDRVKRIDKKIKDKMRPSLKEGERIALMRDTETDTIGWYIVKPDGSKEFLLEVPR